MRQQVIDRSLLIQATFVRASHSSIIRTISISDHSGPRLWPLGQREFIADTDPSPASRDNRFAIALRERAATSASSGCCGVNPRHCSRWTWGHLPKSWSSASIALYKRMQCLTCQCTQFPSPAQRPRCGRWAPSPPSLKGERGQEFVRPDVPSGEAHEECNKTGQNGFEFTSLSGATEGTCGMDSPGPTCYVPAAFGTARQLQHTGLRI